MIYTFYSYKGGVGRSMALANVAELFYQAGKKVLMVDWDLEAPGLERYFPHLDLESVLSQPGVIDMLLGYKHQMEQKAAIPEVGGGDLPFEKPSQFAIDIYPDESGPGQLLLLPAGQRNGPHFAQYAQAVHEFDWNDFYANWEGELYFDWLQGQLNDMADLVLIDSRTGVTEMSGVCTQHLADTVVMFCTPNQQSLDGTKEFAYNLKRPKLHDLRGGRPLELLIVPARVEDRAEVERLSKFEEEFTAIFDDFLTDTLEKDLASFWNLKIPHVPYYAFDETVAVREHGNFGDRHKAGAEDMIDAFVSLKEIMAKLDPDLLPEKQAVAIYISKRAWDKATSLLDNYDFLKDLYKTGQADTLDDWLSKLPMEELEEHPELLILWGMILNDDFGQPKRAMTFFVLAEEQFHERNDLVGIIKAQIWQSVGLRMMGQANKAIELASEGLDQLKNLDPDNSRLIAWATRNRGLAHGTAGNFVQALSDTRQALMQFEVLGDRYMTGLCHHDIGVSLEKQANIREAERHYRLAINVWRELGNSNNLANTLVGLGKILSEAGHYDEALEGLQEGLDIALKIKAIRRAAFAQAGIGDVYFGLNKYEEAVKAYTLSNGYAQDAQVRSLEIANQIKLSECYYYPSPQQDLTKSLDLANQARSNARENGLTFEEGLACILQAKIHIQLNEYESSFELLDKAAGYFANNNVKEQIIETEILWAYGLWLDKKIPEAFNHLQNAVKLIFSLDNLMLGLKKTLREFREFLVYFVNEADIPTKTKSRLELLIRQSNDGENVEGEG